MAVSSSYSQIKAVEAERHAMEIPPASGTFAPMTMLLGLKGIGPEFAASLYSKACSVILTRKQVAAHGGLAPSPR
jgi:transposase